MIRFLACLLLLTQLTVCIADDADVELILEGLDKPWGMTFIDDKRMIVTQKVGSSVIVDTHTGDVEDIEGIPEIEIVGQGGLMDVAKSPNFSKDSILYFTYAKPITKTDAVGKQKTSYATSLASAKLEKNRLIDWNDLFVSNVQTSARQHFGSRITFDNKGHLFFSHGDRGKRFNAQDLSNHAGTILRLHLDGSVPSDNPFVGDLTAQPEIWSYGHRNPQGIFYDLKTDQLWSNEHGPRGGDEINLIHKGANYGWPTLSYGREYGSGKPVGETGEREGFVSPIKYYVPSIAPSSLIRYTGDKFPQLTGSFLSGALVLRHLNIVDLDQQGIELKETRLLETLSERIRNVAQSPNGDIFIATDGGDIYKLLNVFEQ